MTDAAQEFMKTFAVSYETKEMLSCYERMLVEWNEKFNLVASSTLPHVWMRHFADSAQLMSYIPDNAQTLADMGAGAGFPGLVLAIMAQERKQPLQVTAIESIGKKAEFLQAVVDRLGLKAVIRRERIEAIRDLKADIVTARALKALPELLKYANYLMHKDTICLFLKGKNLGDELTQAQKYWIFTPEIHPSRSDDSGQVLVLRNIRYKSRR